MKILENKVVCIILMAVLIAGGFLLGGYKGLAGQYQKAEKKDHPRMIALDEAFAGVDDKNISSMFELVEKLDFDYIMNSQALWGCFETVHALRIAELLRPLNSKTVSVIYYSWNGKERVLDE